MRVRLISKIFPGFRLATLHKYPLVLAFPGREGVRGEAGGGRGCVTSRKSGQSDLIPDTYKSTIIQFIH